MTTDAEREVRNGARLGVGVSNAADTLQSWARQCEAAAARITSDAATIAAKDAEIERLRNYCGAAARDYAGTLAALEEAAGGGILESFPRTAKDLRETSEFMALAAEGKEDPSRWGAELNDAKARIVELQTQATRAIRKCRNAVEFFDKVKVATEGEKTAVGRDHWDRLESAVRYVAALNTGEIDAG